MKQKIFIDTDVFLDTILARSPHCDFSNQLLSLCEKNELEGYTSSLVIANIYYIIQKLANKQKALIAINKIRAFIHILPFTDKDIGESISVEFDDFEDGVQYFIALNHKIMIIITRNVKDFQKAKTAVFSPKEFLQTEYK